MPRISSVLGAGDRLGGWKARWGIGRMSYLVPPGLYAIGSPGADDPVVVTANYKMSYDIVRRVLHGRNAWLLVLETFGINVWCAAGKGTFGTNELIRRLAASRLERVIRHRTLLLPILGAPGIAAHVVTRRTGFHVRYATIRAADLPEFLDNGMMTTAAMRQMSFTFRERLALVPVEVVMALKPTLLVAAILFLLGCMDGGVPAGFAMTAAFIGAVVAGTIAVPLLLPWLPGPSFAVKGAVTGLAWSVAWYVLAGDGLRLPSAVGIFLALTAVSSFYALNFTGSTPFTSRSGVRKEMRLALPTMAGALAVAAFCCGWAIFF